MNAPTIPRILAQSVSSLGSNTTHCVPRNRSQEIVGQDVVVRRRPITNSAGFGGVKAPTGSDDKSDSLGRLPISVQPGTGAWDGFGGIVATYQTLEYQLDGQLAYRANGSAHSFEAGDETRLDGSLQYRLWPRTLGADLVGFLYGVLETNLVYRDRNEAHGQDDPNSGGTTLFLTPGLQFVTKRVILEVAVQLPVSQNLNGTALETDYILRTGFRWNF